METQITGLAAVARNAAHPDAELLQAVAKALGLARDYDAAIDADAHREATDAIYKRECEAFELARVIPATTARGLRAKVELLERWEDLQEGATLALAIVEDAARVARGMIEGA